MNTNQIFSMKPQCSRAAALVASVVALVLAAGGAWLLSRSADAPRPPADMPASPALSALEPRNEANDAAAGAVLPAASPASSLVQPKPIGSLADALRKVQQTLDGPATPQEMLEAAAMLGACQGAEVAVESMVALRDQPSPGWELHKKRYGLSDSEQIQQQQDFQRSCQVFDAAALARRGELLKGAYEGGAKDSALPYLLWLNESGQAGDPELRGKLQREAREMVEAGDFMGLLHYSHAFDPAPLGINEVQRQAYKEARMRIAREMSGVAMEKATRASMDSTEKMMAQLGALPPPLSPQQQREADALAQQVLEAWRKRQDKGS